MRILSATEDAVDDHNIKFGYVASDAGGAVIGVVGYMSGSGEIDYPASVAPAQVAC